VTWTVGRQGRVERRVLAREPSYRWDRHQGRVTDRTLQNWMELIEQRAGIEDGTGRLHILRHTFCSRLAEAGAPAGHIQKLAGHASITTTERYMHYSEEGKERAIALLGGGQVHSISVATKQGSRRSPVISTR